MPVTSLQQRWLLVVGLLVVLTALRPAAALSRGPLTTRPPRSRNSVRGRRLREQQKLHAVGDGLAARDDVGRATAYLMTRAPTAGTAVEPAAPTAVIAPTAAAAPRPPSAAAQWHLERRRAILAKHPEVRALMAPDLRGVPLLLVANGLQLWLACAAAPRLASCASVFGLWAAAALALTVGGTLSLVQFSVLHDVLHGGVVKSPRAKKALLWAGSQPAVFGYFLYLRSGHLAHHGHVGDASLGELFQSPSKEFEDGDVLFVAHRQKLNGPGFPMSLSAHVFGAWQPGAWRRNLALYCGSMLTERALLAVNDKVVAATGRNSAFFPNKPPSFHAACAAQARLSALVQLGCYWVGGWPALGYLWLAEVAWQLPTHPAAAMFVSNHESRTVSTSRTSGTTCQPSTSVYLGKWYDWATACANYHVEHHDFPEVPLFQLPALRQTAIEFYTPGAAPPLPTRHTRPASPYVACTEWWPTLKHAFLEKRFYACTGAGTLLS